MEKIKLGDIASVITKGTTPTSIGFNFIEQGINFIKIESITEDGSFINDKFAHISEECYSRLKRSQIKENDILFSIAGAIGRVAVVNNEILPANTNQALAIIRVDDRYDKEFLTFLLRSSFITKQYNKKKQGVAQINLSLKDISELEIPIIDINKQLEIKENLKNIIKIINLRKKQLEDLNNIIKSQFVEMFQCGNYPKDELGKLCDVRDGTHDSPKYLEESEYKFITSKNIVNNEIDFSEAKYISKQDYDKFNTRSKVNYGDILMPMIGTIGKPIIVNIPDEKIDFAIKNVALIKFLENSKVTNIYIKNLFDSDYFENAISQNKRGGTQKFIALSDIRKLEIEIPPIELQNKFAEFVKQIDKQKFEIENSLKEMQELYESLMEKYFG